MEHVQSGGECLPLPVPRDPRFAPRTEFVVPLPKQPQKLPEILSREEVWRLLTAPPHPRHRLILAVVYAAGLRVSEAIALKVSDIDADRMTIRIAQGKGAKDRYVPLAKRLLQDLRAYWKTKPPGVWLFANRQGSRPSTSPSRRRSTRWPSFALASRSTAAFTRSAMPSPRISSKPGPISTPCSACWGTATSRPPSAISI